MTNEEEIIKLLREISVKLDCIESAINEVNNSVQTYASI